MMAFVHKISTASFIPGTSIVATSTTSYKSVSSLTVFPPYCHRQMEQIHGLQLYKQMLKVGSWVEGILNTWAADAGSVKGKWAGLDALLDWHFQMLKATLGQVNGWSEPAGLRICSFLCCWAAQGVANRHDAALHRYPDCHVRVSHVAKTVCALLPALFAQME